MAKLAEVLPAGTYRRANGEPGPALHGWVTGQYRFDRDRAAPSQEGPLVLLTTEVQAIARQGVWGGMVPVMFSDMGRLQVGTARVSVALHHAVGEALVSRNETVATAGPPPPIEVLAIETARQRSGEFIVASPEGEVHVFLQIGRASCRERV